ncbi:MAG: hypothetical protein WDO15_06885 [Bacteroidota bacterium]
MSRLLLLVGFALTSCAPAYISNTRNTPMFGEANEFAGSVAISSGLDVQTAYSVSDHVAIMAKRQHRSKEIQNGGYPINKHLIEITFLAKVVSDISVKQKDHASNYLPVMAWAVVPATNRITFFTPFRNR